MSKFAYGNVFEKVEFCQEKEIQTELFNTQDYYIERITSKGQESDFYIQEEAEFVVLMQGTAEIWVEGQGTKQLEAGSYLFLDRRLKHRVTKTIGECIWLCFFVK